MVDAVHQINIDIETYSDVDLGKAGLYKYAQSPAFQVLLFAYSVDGGPVEVIDLTMPGVQLPDMVRHWLLDPNVIKHAYNAAFEWFCLSRLLGMDEVQTGAWADQWRCTMLHGQYCGLPAGLGAVGAAMGLPADKQKDGIGKSLITYFCKPCKPTKTNGGRTRNLPHHDTDKWRLFVEYNRQDVIAEMEIERRLSGFPVPDAVQRQWALDQRINLRGVAVDLDLVDAALELDAANHEALVAEAQQVSGLDNPNSVAQLKRWLEKELDEEVPDLQKDTVSDLLGRDIPNEDAIRILEIRQALGKASNRKYATMRTAAGTDGRLRGMMQYYGANRTGREAGRLVQLQNLPHDVVPYESLARQMVKARNTGGIEYAYGSIPHTLSALIRTALVAGPGYTLIDADFSSVEARVIAWLAGEQWALEVFRSHGKIYEATASRLYGVPMDKIVKGNPEYKLRQYGKAATLALGYQGGTPALINAGRLPKDTPEVQLREIVDQWRAANPYIKAFWYALDAASKQAVFEGRPGAVQIPGGPPILFAREIDQKNNLDYMTVTLPSGRKLYYAYPGEGVDKFGRPSITYWGQGGSGKKWKCTETYGGKLSENITQAVARDCLFFALENLEAAGYRIIFTVHDEVVLEVPEGTADLADVVRIMSQTPPWAPGLPLNADGWINDFYHKD